MCALGERALLLTVSSSVVTLLSDSSFRGQLNMLYNGSLEPRDCWRGQSKVAEVGGAIRMPFHFGVAGHIT